MSGKLFHLMFNHWSFVIGKPRWLLGLETKLELEQQKVIVLFFELGNLVEIV